MTDNTNTSDTTTVNEGTAQVSENNQNNNQPIDLKIGDANGNEQVSSQGVDTTKNVENKDKTQDDKNKDNVNPFEKTGDTGLDVALDFAFKHGYTPENEMILAATNGDWSLLEADLATKNVPGYKEMIELAKKGWDNLLKSEMERSKAIESSVMQVCNNDAELFNSVREFVRKNASQDEINELNRMLGENPIQARSAMNLMLSAYKESTGTVVKTISALQENSNVTASNSGTAITREQYINELNALDKKLGGNLNNSPEYQLLQQRRFAGIKNGI